MASLCCGLVCCNSEETKSSQKAPKNGQSQIVTTGKSRKTSKKFSQKILLLGTGESGKSTFLKQMRIITGKQFSNEELLVFKDIIYDNIYKGVLYLLQARATLNVPWAGGPGCAGERSAEFIEEHFKETRIQRKQRAILGNGTPLWTEEEFLAIAPHFKTIWDDSSIRIAFDQRNRLITEDFVTHSENTRFYLSRLSDIATPEYVPTEEDIVWSRRPTDRIIEEEIFVRGTSLIFIDVGGQTRERRKWCQTFTDMTSVLFLVASSHYDELYLDRVTGEYRNKLREAMTVFECLINLASFRRVSIILFFNKSDILKEKITARVSGIRAQFPEFPPTADEFRLTDVQSFLVEMFAGLVDPVVCSMEDGSPNVSHRFSGLSRRISTPSVGRSASLSTPSSAAVSVVAEKCQRRRTIYRHFTTAIDKKNIETVFNAMQDTILSNNLRRLMLS